MASVAELGPLVGVTAACETLGVARASFYRQAHPLAARDQRTTVASDPVGGPIGSTLPSPSLRHEGAVGERSEQILPPQDADPGASPPPPSARVHPRALSIVEQTAVLEVLHSTRFQDAAPATVYAIRNGLVGG